MSEAGRTVRLATTAIILILTLDNGSDAQESPPGAATVQELRATALKDNSLQLLRATETALKQSSATLSGLAANLDQGTLSEATRAQIPTFLEQYGNISDEAKFKVTGDQLRALSQEQAGLAAFLGAAAIRASMLPPRDAVEALRDITLPGREGIVHPPEDGEDGPPVLGSLPVGPLALSGVVEGAPLPGRASIAADDRSRPFIVGVDRRFRSIDYPVVGSLLDDMGGGLETRCSGTLVNQWAFLTAAHCFCGKSAAANCAVLSSSSEKSEIIDRMRVYLPQSGVHRISNVVVHSGYVWDDARRGQADLALVALASPATGITPIRINDAAPIANGTTGTVIGYGVHSATDSEGQLVRLAFAGDTGNAVDVVDTERYSYDTGVKLFASILTASCPDNLFYGLLCWEYRRWRTQGSGSTCVGDSGGPLLVSVAGEMVLAGVTSAGGTCLPGDVPSDTDVFTYREWIRESSEALKPATLPTADFALLHPVRNSDYFVSEASHIFGDPAVLEIEGTLPSSYVKARVSVNGTYSGAELKLSVRDNTSNALVCDIGGVDTAKTCEWKSSGAQAVKVVVTGSRYQEVQVVGVAFSPL